MKQANIKFIYGGVLTFKYVSVKETTDRFIFDIGGLEKEFLKNEIEVISCEQ